MAELPQKPRDHLHRFLDGTTGHGNVVFNFVGHPSEDLWAFGAGYRAAGKALADRIAESHAYPDYEGYPVLFLYRHALELYLKAVVYQHARLLGIASGSLIDRSLFKTHDLTRLLPAIKAIWQARGLSFEGTAFSSFDDFATFIRSLHDIERASASFRYPVACDGEPAFPHHLALNVVFFGRCLDGLLDHLHAYAQGLEEEFELGAEARSELQQLFEDQRDACPDDWTE